jgi:ribonuclease P protein component
VTSLAFPSALRIKHSKDFESAFRNKSLNNKWFAIYVQTNTSQTPRLGMVVSKRVISKSVYRNYAKRLIRESFRHNFLQLPALDFIIKIRRNLSRDSVVEARLALNELMISAGLK